MGYAGQISLGHAAFYGIAAYATAIATTRFSLPVPVGMGIGIVLTTIIAWIVAVPTLKLKGHYLAMATLGFGIIVAIVFNEAVDWTGGPSGYVGIPPLAFGDYAVDTDRRFYNLMVVVLALVVLVARNLMASRTGRASAGPARQRKGGRQSSASTSPPTSASFSCSRPLWPG